MDKDILKKAVELAGWQTTKLGNQRIAVFIPSDECDAGQLLKIGYLDQPHILDALAAQLVRQVDALEPTKDEKIILTVYHDATDIHAEFRQGLSGYRDIISVPGKDRTENTITTVVESKVLEKGGGK